MEIDLSNMKEMMEKAEETRLDIAVTIINSMPQEKRTLIVNDLYEILIMINKSKTQSVDSDKENYHLGRLQGIFYFSGVILNILLDAVGITQKNGRYALEKSFEDSVGRVQKLREYYRANEDIEKNRRIVQKSAGDLLLMPLKAYEKDEYLRDGDLIMEGTVQIDPEGCFALYTEDGLEWHNDNLFNKFKPGTQVKIFKKGDGFEVKE